MYEYRTTHTENQILEEINTLTSMLNKRIADYRSSRLYGFSSHERASVVRVSLELSKALARLRKNKDTKELIIHK
jgi:hypothetical protein